MAKILVVDDSPTIVQLIRLALAEAGHEIRVAENGALGVAAAKEWLPDLIVMDINMPGMNGYEATRLLRRNASTANTPILILSAQDSIAEKLNGFEAGADDYLTKPFEPGELDVRVTAHLNRAQDLLSRTGGDAPPEENGLLIACFSLRGGSGVSTLAVNLSTSLARIWNRPCALLDLALTGGHDSLLLNLPLKRTWADLAAVPLVEFDGDFVEKHLSRHDSGVRVLASPANPEDGEQVKVAHVARVLELLRPRYDYLMVDLPHDFRETTLTVLDAADIILMPFPPDIASVRSAIAALHTFDALGYSSDKVRLVLNWTFPKLGLAQADIERFLKHKIDFIIPYDLQDLVKAVNSGQPLVLGAPTHPLTALLEDYAFRLSPPGAVDAMVDKDNPHYQRVLSRAQARAASAKK